MEKLIPQKIQKKKKFILPPKILVPFILKFFIESFFVGANSEFKNILPTGLSDISY